MSVSSGRAPASRPLLPEPGAPREAAPWCQGRPDCTPTFTVARLVCVQSIAFAGLAGLIFRRGRNRGPGGVAHKSVQGRPRRGPGHLRPPPRPSCKLTSGTASAESQRSCVDLLPALLGQALLTARCPGARSRAVLGLSLPRGHSGLDCSLSPLTGHLRGGPARRWLWDEAGSLLPTVEVTHRAKPSRGHRAPWAEARVCSPGVYQAGDMHS